MAENSFSSVSRLPTLKPQLQAQPLSESHGNQLRHNNMAPPQTKGIPQKRPGSQLPASTRQDAKVAKTGSVQGRSIASFSQSSAIARPASAASRHAPAMQSRIGMGRPPQRPQTAKPRPTAERPAVDKEDGSSDVTMSSRNTSFSSRVISNATSIDLLEPSGRSVSFSSTSTLNRAFEKMGLHSEPVNERITVRKRSHLPIAKVDLSVRTPAQPVFQPKRQPSPRKSPSKSPIKEQGFFLTKDSNMRVPLPDFNVEQKLDDFTLFMKNFESSYQQSASEQQKILGAIDLYKSKVEELEAYRSRLEANNASLQKELDEAKSACNAALFRADEIRREHLNELDDVRRRNRNEVDEIRSKYKEELEDFRRARRESRDHASAASQEEMQLIEKRHQAELEDLRRELTWALDEEKRERRREVQTLQDEAQAAQRNAESGSDRHARELGDKEERVLQLSKQVEREREIADDLRKQLFRSGEQSDELENAARSLKARVEFLQSDNQSQSQAFADLEQQTQDALKQTEEYRNQLRREETVRRKLLNQIQDLKGNIRVFCRVRPPLSHEQGSCAQIELPDIDADAKEIQVRGPQETSSLGKDMTKTHPFSFDRAFGPESENAKIFTELSELVAAVCGGSFNTCIFSYGQTGSGKTYTMASPDGMISRAVYQIFDTAANLVDKGWEYQVTGSFVEVYNENINDLLGRPEDFDKKKHEIRHDLQKQTTTITDVIETPLDSAEHFGSVLEQALQNRSIAATKANERSSRSHSVCILRIEGRNHTSGETCSSTLNLVDLAGSERLGHSQATGAQLKETQNINKSLSCLKDVIAALGDAKEGSHVPYRNSKLTYLLQNSLGGNSKTLMFVMISPLQEHLSETLSSLNFATKVNNTRIIKKGKK